MEKKAYKQFGEQYEEMEDVTTTSKSGRKNRGNEKSGSDGHGSFTKAEPLRLAKAWVVQSKKLIQRVIHLQEIVRETFETV